ncbi:MAG: hydroxymethylbilane synthase [Polyangiaceae bacterium UTPRO1]|jgi:hydroxymethylbilane synthase|nr:hydroxymethylbilane synthase [Myxococcales bacterium]OQY65638.1 MAG: hydroxymethylbilane synthase [Polyangiaceae bacterium UTPRO1]
MNRTALRLGTRGSALALCQSGLVAAAIESRGTPVEIVTIRTSGDVATGSLAALGGKGLFVKEIEEALLRGRIDLAVHSLKDVPAVLPAGLELAATPPRADPRDVVVSPAGVGLERLPAGMRVGTSSLRRRAQLAALRPDLAVVDMRGNVDTRLKKLAAGEVDAVLLAAAGLERLGLAPSGLVAVPAARFLPAIGQGILALEVRADDAATRAVVAALDDAPTRAAAAAERAFLAAIGGDCHTPLAAYATVRGAALGMRAIVASVDGRTILGDAFDGPCAAAVEIGTRLAAALLTRGAGELIARAGTSRS